MTILEKIASATASLLKDNYGYSVEPNSIQIDSTRKEFSGEYTLVVFPFVKALGMKPEDAGKTIGEFLQKELPEIVGFNVIKGFLNLNLSANYWSHQLHSAISDPTWFEPAANEHLILVEYSSPNTNKPLHLGHLRNNFLGYSVSLIKEFCGNEVVKTQIVNDRGVHICKSMLAWKMHGKGENPESSGLKGDKLVGKYYVLYDQHLKSQVAALTQKGLSEDEANKQAPLTQVVQEMLQKWEQGDEETLALWKMMNGWVYEGFASTYDLMGVEFDRLYFESNTYSKGKDIVVSGLEKEVFYQKEDGSIWCNLEPDGMDQKLLVRGDGTTVYMTQDIGTAVQRYEDYPRLSQVIYTVGDEQDYHFKVLFKILEKLGYNWAAACKHLSYGMVDLPSGKMKSREGTVVDADDLMEEVVAAAKASSAEKGKLEELSETERNSLFEMLGVGALKFFLLRVDPRKRMLFDPVESVSLNGDTGPFVQYTHARCKAVLRKAGDFEFASVDSLGEKETALIRYLCSFRSEMQSAGDNLNPAAVANYSLELAKLYNQFYHDLPILKAEGEVRNFRLTLTKLTAETIQKAMSLLGIGVPEQM
jgi:arginyl-tRNA synthetase